MLPDRSVQRLEWVFYPSVGHREAERCYGDSAPEVNNFNQYLKHIDLVLAIEGPNESTLILIGLIRLNQHVKVYIT